MNKISHIKTLNPFAGISYSGFVSYCVPIRNIADYSPFGVQLDGRTISMDSYRYGFQNQEKDDELKGAGNSVNYKYRMHDPRVGRFFAVDPLAANYSYNSPYAFSENVVIDCIELEGLEKIDHLVYSKKEKIWKVAWTETDNNLKENVNAYHYYNKDCYGKSQNYQTVVKPMDEKSKSPERVVYIGNIQQTYQNRLQMYQQFESTDNAKKSLSDLDLESKVSNSVSQDVTYYSGLEGNDDGLNNGNNAASEQAPNEIKAVIGLIPVMSVVNLYKMASNDKNMYHQKATKEEAASEVASLIMFGIGAASPDKSIGKAASGTYDGQSFVDKFSEPEETDAIYKGLDKVITKGVQNGCSKALIKTD